MSSANLTIIGNLCADPELRFTNSGAAVANFTVAVTERVKNGDQWEDGDTTFYRCAVWREYAENAAETLRKGMQVFVTGRVKLRPFERNDGTTGASLDVQVDEVGPTLRWATANVQRASRGNGGGGARRQSQQTNDDPWGSSAQAGGFGGGDDEPPF